MNDTLTTELLTVTHSENLSRSEANAAEPYVHAVYAEHEDRIKRLVTALADGNEELYDRFYDALFDITHDGLEWLMKVWTEMVRDYGVTGRDSYGNTYVTVRYPDGETETVNADDLVTIGEVR